MGTTPHLSKRAARIAAADTTGMVTAATAAAVTDTAADTADTATVTKTTKADKERTGDEGRQISHRRFFALSGHPRKQKGSTDSRDAGMRNAACKWNPKDLIQRTGWGIIQMSTQCNFIVNERARAMFARKTANITEIALLTGSLFCRSERCVPGRNFFATTFANLDNTTS